MNPWGIDVLGKQFTTLQPPVSIPIMSHSGTLSPEWRFYFNSLQQFLIKFQNVITVPSLTQDQINALNPLANGFIVYNNTVNSFQGYVDGAWKTFTLT